MANMENTTIWRQIQTGVKETERLIGRKEYNLAMIKARQTLEYMVRCLAERACLVEGDLSDTIDQLYEGRWIDKNTKERYHTIRVLGNKAVHEGDDTAYDANQAYQLLAKEVSAFANQGNRPMRTSGQRTSSNRSASRNTARSQSARRTSSSSNRSSGQRRRSSNSRRGGDTSSLYNILRFLVPVLALVLILILVIRFFAPSVSENGTETSPAVTETAQATSEAETEAPTQPETEAAQAAVYIVTGNGVRIREEPATDGRVIAQVSEGTELEYVKRYNNDWTVVNYEGQEAYISSQYIAPRDQPQETEPEASEEAAQ